MEFIQDTTKTKGNIDFIGLYFEFAIFLFDNYEDNAIINPQKIQEEFNATLPLFITKRLKNEIPYLIQIFIQTHLLSNEKSTKKKQLLILNKSWRPVIENIKHRNKIRSFENLSQEDQQEIEDLKQRSSQRKSKTISMLSVLVLNELRNGIISRDLISQNTGFARQRICTVLSVFKALGIVKETGTRRTLRVVLNKNKLRNISSIFEQTKRIRNLRERKKKLFEKTQDILNRLEQVHIKNNRILDLEIQKSCLNKIRFQLNRKMNHKLKIKKQQRRVSKIQIPNLKKRQSCQKDNSESNCSAINNGHLQKNNEKTQTQTQLLQKTNSIDPNVMTNLFAQEQLTNKEFRYVDEKTGIKNFQRQNRNDHQKNPKTTIIKKKKKKSKKKMKSRKAKIILKKFSNFDANNSSNNNNTGTNLTPIPNNMSINNFNMKLESNFTLPQACNKKQIKKPTLKISTKLIRETFNPNLIPTQISPLIRDDNMNIRLSSPFFEIDLAKENFNTLINFEDTFDFQSTISPILPNINPFTDSKIPSFSMKKSENKLKNPPTTTTASIPNELLNSFTQPPAINNINSSMQSPYVFLNSPPLCTKLNQNKQKMYQQSSNIYQSHNQKNTLLSPRLKNGLMGQNLKNDNSQFKTPYFINKQLPDLAKLIGSDYK
ncbi:hypothetical protein M0813_10683 [Anaeramoeba flamelloides]|uniref:B-block binding subunit of TFIIIC domain-containing protein n=1 Tax=Anaeramoeba flamelloides TaxID=1746091 RepID=A0ABQ8X1E0_9EUKA|nr:hypothetical protein M0813_10683 [Anaeramoeba flamelloides]